MFTFAFMPNFSHTFEIKCFLGFTRDNSENRELLRFLSKL